MRCRAAILWLSPLVAPDLHHLVAAAHAGLAHVQTYGAVAKKVQNKSLRDVVCAHLSQHLDIDASRVRITRVQL